MEQLCEPTQGSLLSRNSPPNASLTLYALGSAINRPSTSLVVPYFFHQLVTAMCKTQSYTNTVACFAKDTYAARSWCSCLHLDMSTSDLLQKPVITGSARPPALQYDLRCCFLQRALHALHRSLESLIESQSKPAVEHIRLSAGDRILQ